MAFSTLENFLSMFTDGKGTIDGKEVKSAYIGIKEYALKFNLTPTGTNGLKVTSPLGFSTGNIDASFFVGFTGGSITAGGITYDIEFPSSGTLKIIPASGSASTVSYTYDAATGVLSLEGWVTNTWTFKSGFSKAVDYLVGEVARKIKKGYISVNDVAQLFFETVVAPEEMTVEYTGNFTDEIVTMGDGKQYRLLTLTSAGTLILESETTADVWLCGGGSNGNESTGGDGAYYNQLNGITVKSAIVAIGSAGGVSSFAGKSSKVTKSATGGTGGYDFGHGTHGSNAAKSTKPFGDSYFTKYPCAGGAGGRSVNSYSQYFDGGGGGNGSPDLGVPYSTGGTTGGGASGAAVISGNTGGNASYYGSGGGGGGRAYYSPNTYTGTGGSGYQGVCFVRIPLEQ